MYPISSIPSFKRKLYKIINAIAVVAAILVNVYLINTATRRLDADIKEGEFFKDSQEYDVLFFGSSHMLHSINPIILYEEYGITSFNHAGPATWTQSSFWLFENAIKVHKPKVAVLEVFSVWNKKEEQNYSMLHHTYDAFPLNRTKVKAIYDVTEDKKQRAELLFPFTLYHSRWDEIGIEDVVDSFKKYKITVEKGSEYKFSLYEDAETKGINFRRIGYNAEESRFGQSYIVRFIERCREEGIEPFLLYCPYDAVIELDLISSIVEQYNVPYLNLYKIRNEAVNNKTDYADQAHLNFSGTGKVTHIVGQTLSEQFHFSKGKDNKEWNKYVEQYKTQLIDQIISSEDIIEILLILSDSNFNARIIIPADIKYQYSLLLDQLSDKCDIIQDESNENISVTVYDTKSNELLTTKTLKIEKITTINLSDLYTNPHTFVSADGIHTKWKPTLWSTTRYIECDDIKNYQLEYFEPWSDPDFTVYKVGLYDENYTFLGGYPAMDEKVRVVNLDDAIASVNGCRYVVISGIEGDMIHDGFICRYE